VDGSEGMGTNRRTTDVNIMGIQEDILAINARIDDLANSQAGTKNDLITADWVRLGIEARLRELEKKKDDKEELGNMDNPEAESPYFDAPAGFPYGDGYSFGLSVLGSTATIYPGYVVGTTRRAVYESTETDVSLSSSGDSYIYAYVNKVGAPSLTIHNANVAAMPVSNDAYYIFPLYKMNSPDGATYNLVEPILGGQSIVVGSPVGW